MNISKENQLDLVQILEPQQRPAAISTTDSYL